MQAWSDQKIVATAVVEMHNYVAANPYSVKNAIEAIRCRFDGERRAWLSKDGQVAMRALLPAVIAPKRGGCGYSCGVCFGRRRCKFHCQSRVGNIWDCAG